MSTKFESSETALSCQSPIHLVIINLLTSYVLIVLFKLFVHLVITVGELVICIVY